VNTASKSSGVIVSLGADGEHLAVGEDAWTFLDTTCGAVFDASRKYRYLLWRRWNQELPALTFCMLNPSTADAFRLDPTIARCMSFARDWGFGSLRIVNIFAYRSTDPAALQRRRDPVGKLNDQFIERAIHSSQRSVLAWGNHGILRDRDKEMMLMMRKTAASDRLYHLGLTRLQQPKHPLYVRRDAGLHGFETPV
jgi:hypothetical protein